ncbi:MAG: hypothetical protein V2J24_14550 [Pseudomonadales bacterium]|nr:hypothetical protein [Pseudomonadales bacterium]
MQPSRRFRFTRIRSRQSFAPLLMILTLLTGLPAAADFERLTATLDTSTGSYEGQNLNGSPHGEGRMEWSDGRVFEGEFFDGQVDGEGELTWPDGMRYRGPVVTGRIEGEARVEFPDGSRYRGPLVNGVPEGVGTYRWPDKARYTGEFVAGERHGWGEMKEADGTRYVGGFAHGERQGQGTLIAADGALYRGDFQAGEFHGYGVRVSPKGRELSLEHWQNGELVDREPIQRSADCNLAHGERSWMVRGTACQGGQAEGVGNAVSTDGTLFIPEGRFERGRLVAGRAISLGQPEDAR